MEDVTLEEPVMVGVSLDDAAMADAMDDLFGDAGESLDLAAVVHLPVLTMPLPPALTLRLADMRASGCCSKLVWANSGSISCISANGKRIDFYVYAQDSKNRWKLSGPSKHPVLAADQQRFVHLQYNLLSSELAVLDTVGRLQLYAPAGGIGKVQASLTDSEEQEPCTEVDAIIGFHWLPIYPLDCRSLYIGPVSRSVNGWTSQARAREQHAIKVHHPADNAKASVMLSRKGVLTLKYQHEGWKRLTQSLDSQDALFTHADFCEYNGHMLAAAYDTSGCLSLFQIAIVWNAIYTPGPNNTQQAISVTPQMQATRLCSTGDACPRHLQNATPTQIKLLPPTAEVVDGDITMPTCVLATFVQADSPEDPLSHFQESSTTLVRWHIASDPRNLVESFGKLKPGSGTFNAQADKTVLRRQPDLITPKVILNVQSKYFDTTVVLTASDGTMEVRERATFDIIEPYMDTDHVTSLVQSGFGYDMTSHNVHAAIANDGATMAHISGENKLDVSRLSFRYGWQSVDSSDISPLAEAAAVCVAREYMILSCSYSSSEEVLSLLPPDLPPQLERLICQEAFRIARHGPDISALDERMRTAMAIKEPIMPKAYGLQLALGSDLHQSRRSVTAQLAWAVLNLRHICFSISQSMSRLDPSQPFPSEPIHSLRGQCRWGVDLIITLIGSLLAVVEKANQDPKQSAVKVLQDHMRESQSPVFLLLLCSMPRTLLKLLVQFIPRLIKFSQVCSNRARSVLERQQLMEIGLMEKTVPFTFDSFKMFLDNIETALRHVKPQLDANGQPLPTADTEMSLTGIIPDQLEQPLRALLVTTIPALLDAADLSRIYFADTSWLGIAGAGSVKAANKFDVLRKLPLREDANVRKCRRCGSMMEDLSTEKPREIMPWLLAASRNCVCTCNWYIP